MNVLYASLMRPTLVRIVGIWNNKAISHLFVFHLLIYVDELIDMIWKCLILNLKIDLWSINWNLDAQSRQGPGLFFQESMILLWFKLTSKQQTFSFLAVYEF